MTTQEKDLRELETQVSQGLKIAHSKMLAFKRYKGTPVVISHNEKIVFVSPEEM